MKSREYPEDIDFQKYLLILKRHWLPATSVWSITVLLAILMTLTTKPIYEAYGKLRLKKQNTTSALVTEAGEKIGKLDSLNIKDTPLDTEAEVIRSAPIVNQTIEALKLRNKQDNPLTYEDFIHNISVKSIRGTDILNLSYKSRDRQEAINVVNKLMEIYIKSNMLTNRSEATAAQEFISQQLPKVEDSVRQADAALRSFKEQNHITDLAQETKGEVAALDNLEQQIQSVNAEIQKVTGRVTEIRNKLGMSSQEALVENAISQSVAAQQVIEKLKQVEAQLAIQRSRFVEDSPQVIDLKSQQVSLYNLLKEQVKQVVGDQKQIPYRDIQKDDQKQTGQLQAKITETLVDAEAERVALINQLASLNAARSAYQQRMESLPKLEQTQRELERKLDASEASYKILLKNLEEVRLAENQNVGNAQIVSPAIAPKHPSASSKKLILGAGVGVGALLYILTAFILELNSRSIKTIKELRSTFGYTLLGTIPASRKKAKFAGPKMLQAVLPQHQVRDLPNSLITETYKMLQANLKFMSPDRQLKVILVTSSVPKEGKSTVSANLAVAMAQLESRVLLIDADLHHPQQHHIWQLTNQVGLSEVIVGRTELSKAVKQVMPNLDVLPSGVIPPNSLALLGSQRMNSLIESFSKTYDFVIIDTPPLLLLADALTLSKMTDGILLVARPGVIDTASVNASKEVLNQSGQNVLGLVINGVIIENEPDSYFHHAKAYSNIGNENRHISVLKS